MRWSAAVLERKAAERRHEALFRVVEGAGIGLLFGAAGSLRHGTGWLDMTKPWERPAIAWAWIGGSAAGGMLAGAFFGWMLPRMRLRRTALAAGLGTAGIYLGVTALFGMDWLHSLLVPVTAPIVGVWAALLARDVSPVVMPHTQREVDGMESPAAILTAWVIRVATHAAGSRVEREAPVLRDYGSTNEAELFAVATEAFFERPHALEREHPELHAALRSLYAFDPAVLHAAAGT